MQFSLNDIAQLQATANYWTKTSTTDTFLEVIIRQRMF